MENVEQMYKVSNNITRDRNKRNAMALIVVTRLLRF